MQELTRTRQRILDFIANRDMYPPTIREIGDALGIRSPNGVHEQLRKLQANGYLAIDSMRQRAVVLTEKGAALARPVSRAVATPERKRRTPGRFFPPKVCEWDDCGKTYFGDICPCIKRML